MADRLYEGLVVAQVDSSGKENHGLRKSTKEDVEYSYATIVMDDSRSSKSSDSDSSSDPDSDTDTDPSETSMRLHLGRPKQQE